MQEKITVHKDPENSVFGIIGKDILTDEEKLYIKVANDSKNNGWMEIPPTPTPTPTISLTPSITPIVSKTPVTSPTNTPTISITPSQTPTPTQTRPNITPSPTSTPAKTTTIYFISSDPVNGGTAVRTDGPANTGTIGIGTGTMQLQASPNAGLKFVGWQASPPDSVLFTDASALNPIAYNFNTVSDVYITAIFVTSGRPACNVCFAASATGRVNIEYVDPNGRITTYSASGLVVGTSYCNYFKAIEILQVFEGSWWWGQCDDGSMGMYPNGFRIDGTADDNGEIMFEYYDAQNVLRTFSGSGYLPFQSVEGLVCGLGLGFVFKGNPNITQAGC